jgi:hypothetical protein
MPGSSPALRHGRRKSNVAGSVTHKTSLLNQKFVHEVSPQSGRKTVAHGVSRGCSAPALSPIPSPAQAGEGRVFTLARSASDNIALSKGRGSLRDEGGEGSLVDAFPFPNAARDQQGNVALSYSAPSWITQRHFPRARKQITRTAE